MSLVMSRQRHVLSCCKAPVLRLRQRTCIPLCSITTIHGQSPVYRFRSVFQEFFPDRIKTASSHMYFSDYRGMRAPSGCKAIDTEPTLSAP